jgi:hypothetical protein
VGLRNKIKQKERSMDYINNKGEKIGSLTNAVSIDRAVTINRLNDATTVTTRDRHGQGHIGDILWRFAVWRVVG